MITDRHQCHAVGCQTAVPPKLLMCRRHWAMVPRDLQRSVWDHYRPGQEVDRRPTEAYLGAARAAIAAVVTVEARRARDARRSAPLPLFPDDPGGA